MYAAVSEENQRKNLAFGLAQGISPDRAQAFTWSFDQSRVLHVSIAGLTGIERAALATTCNAQFGPGKVIVN